MREEIERALTFRHDRSGHNRLFVHRGELPLPEVTMKKLAGRGYSVWTDSGPDQEIADLMVARGHKPKEAGEWVATKTIWIESTVVGSPELPYIPGMRQVR
jgi:hypothetical protein